MKRVSKTYPKSFKIEGVRLFLKNGRKINRTAEELGIPRGTLRGWIEKHMSEAKEPNKDKFSKKEYEEALKEKEKRIKELEEENLILKKSIAIFTRNPQQK